MMHTFSTVPIWMCHDCGRTVSVTLPCSGTPSTMCDHRMDLNHMTVMTPNEAAERLEEGMRNYWAERHASQARAAEALQAWPP